MHYLKRIVNIGKNPEESPSNNWKTDIEYLKKSPDRLRISTIPELKGISVIGDHSNQKKAISDEEYKQRIHHEMARRYKGFSVESVKNYQPSPTISKVTNDSNITSNFKLPIETSKDNKDSFEQKNNHEKIESFLNNNKSEIDHTLKDDESASSDYSPYSTPIKKQISFDMDESSMNLPASATATTSNFSNNNESNTSILNSSISLVHLENSSSKKNIERDSLSLPPFSKPNTSLTEDRNDISFLMKQLSPLSPLSARRGQSPLPPASAIKNEIEGTELFSNHDPASPKCNRDNLNLKNSNNNLCQDIQIKITLASQDSLDEDVDIESDIPIHKKIESPLKISTENICTQNNSAHSHEIDSSSKSLNISIQSNNTDNPLKNTVSDLNQSNHNIHSSPIYQSPIKQQYFPFSLQSQIQNIESRNEATHSIQSMHPLLQSISHDLPNVLHERAVSLIYESYVEQNEKLREEMKYTALQYLKSSSILFQNTKSRLLWAEILLQSSLYLSSNDAHHLYQEIEEIIDPIIVNSFTIEREIVFKAKIIYQAIQKKKHDIC